jgi:hypothetical protein
MAILAEDCRLSVVWKVKTCKSFEIRRRRRFLLIIADKYRFLQWAVELDLGIPVLLAVLAYPKKIGGHLQKHVMRRKCRGSPQMLFPLQLPWRSVDSPSARIDFCAL